MSHSLRRILMTTDTVGGVWQYALELIAGLESHDVQVALATMGPPVSAAQREELAQFHHVVLHESQFKLEWMEDPWADVDAAGDWLLEIARAFQPDIIHLNGYAHAALEWPAPVVTVAHSCVCSWWEAVKGEQASAGWDQYRERVASGIAGADVLVSPTHAMLEQIRKHYGPASSEVVILNGRDLSAFTPAEKQPFVFSAGRVWDDAKNIRILSQVAPSIEWPVRLAGDARGPEGEAVRLPHIEQLGKVPGDQLREMVATAEIYALPARYEPFGLSVLEAAASGCALVLGDIPTLRELWEEAAVFVSPDDSAALAKAIAGLIQDRDRRLDLQHLAQQRAQFYPASAVVTGYMALYRTLLSRAAGRLEPTG